MLWVRHKNSKLCKQINTKKFLNWNQPSNLLHQSKRDRNWNWSCGRVQWAVGSLKIKRHSQSHVHHRFLQQKHTRSNSKRKLDYLSQRENEKSKKTTQSLKLYGFGESSDFKGRIFLGGFCSNSFLGVRPSLIYYVENSGALAQNGGEQQKWILVFNFI